MRVNKLKSNYLSLFFAGLIAVSLNAHGAGPSAARDPTWAELKAFLAHDRGDEKVYHRENFNCQHFAMSLKDRARDLGFRSAYVILDYHAQHISHAINAFETLEFGTVYIEPQDDSVAYVKKGKTFGTIPMDALKREFYACAEGGPAGFAVPLAREYFAGNVFEHAYYENYIARVSCYSASRDALDADINAYNQALRQFEADRHAFHHGKSRYSRYQINQKLSDINSWHQKISTWSANLKAFRADLGHTETVDQGVVSKVSAFWN